MNDNTIILYPRSNCHIIFFLYKRNTIIITNFNMSIRNLLFAHCTTIGSTDVISWHSRHYDNIEMVASPVV